MLMLVVLVDQEDKLGGNVDHCDNALLGSEKEELAPVGLQLVDDDETQLAESLVSRANVLVLVGSHCCDDLNMCLTELIRQLLLRNLNSSLQFFYNISFPFINKQCSQLS